MQQPSSAGMRRSTLALTRKRSSALFVPSNLSLIMLISKLPNLDQSTCTRLPLLRGT